MGEVLPIDLITGRETERIKEELEQAELLLKKLLGSRKGLLNIITEPRGLSTEEKEMEKYKIAEIDVMIRQAEETIRTLSIELSELKKRKGRSSRQEMPGMKIK